MFIQPFFIHTKRAIIPFEAVSPESQQILVITIIDSKVVEIGVSKFHMIPSSFYFDAVKLGNLVCKKNHHKSIFPFHKVGKTMTCLKEHHKQTVVKNNLN